MSPSTDANGPGHTPRIGRRGFLGGAVALCAWPLGAPATRRASAQSRLTGQPFTLGVASGYPLPNGVVLWTRLAPTPLQPGGGMPREVVPVEWEVASDDRMSRVVRRGVVGASPEWAHSVHVEVEGLEPAKWYWYRFRAAGEESPIGRTRTAPPLGASVERLRFAFASCQHYEYGYYGAYRHMAADDLDLVVFLGDYIYEYVSPTTTTTRVRQHGAPETITLDDYRIRYALYKSDPDLQAAHAMCPWIMTWDDHEVSNDYADDRSQLLHPREWFLERRAAAYRAYYEHQPLRRQMVPAGAHARLFHRVAFGNLVQFYMLDDRQYRSHQPCVPPGLGGSVIVAGCNERLDPALTMLGTTQEHWLARELELSPARWNVLGQQTLMAQVERRTAPERPAASERLFWTDGWDGYPVARRRLLEGLVQRKTKNPVVIGGDVHSFWVNDLKPDFDNPRSAVVATEFVATSISSTFPRSPETIALTVAANPHVRLADGTRRGYARAEVKGDRLRVDLRTVRDALRRDTEADTLASFVVEDGRPGAVRG